MRVSEHNAELIFRFLRNELTPDQQEELKDWRSASPENEKLFQEETNIENIRSGLKEIHDQKEKIWQKIIEKNPEIGMVAAKRQNYTLLWVAAASLLILMAFGWEFLIHDKKNRSESQSLVEAIRPAIGPGGHHAVLVLDNGRRVLLDTANTGLIASLTGSQINKSGSGSVEYLSTAKGLRPTAGDYPSVAASNTLTTPRGGEFQLTLPDGSRVWLNAASSLRFPTTFTGSQRKVELTGEAYFEVARNKIPFVVSINQEAEVEVLGTHFNIMAYTDEPYMATTLLEGSVKISAISDQGSSATFPSSVLRPGDQARIAKQRIQVMEDVNVDNTISWKNGKIFFRDADIETIMRLISRWYDVDVEYKGAIEKRSITGGISRNASLEELQKILELNKIHFRVEGKKIIVNP